MKIAWIYKFLKTKGINSSENNDFQVKYVKVKLDQEQMETQLNPL